MRLLLRDRFARRVALAYAIFTGAEYAVWIALMVFAYQQGGAAESGLVALTQLVPAALLAPAAGVLADRGTPERTLRYSYGIQSAALLLAAVTLALGGPTLCVYGFVAIMTLASAGTRPAQALVTPRLARTPNELTALNVVTEWTAQTAIFIAPAIAGGLLAFADVDAVFATFAAALAVGALLVPRAAPHGSAARLPREVLPNAWAEVVDGVRVASANPAVRLVLLVSGLGFVVIGALDVLTVVLAIDREGGTASEAAWMTASLGAGGVIGAALGGKLVGRRLAPALAVSAFEFGTALAIIGVFPGSRVAYPMFMAAGIGQAVLAIAAQSLLQRCAPTDSVGRIFALRESLYNLGLATGAVTAPLLIVALGAGGAFLAVGSLLPAVTLIRLALIWRLDSSATIPVVELALLHTVPILDRLPHPALEGLARNAVPVSFNAGDTIMLEGEPGDRFVAIVDGVVDIIRDGVVIAVRSRGDGVGETALLRDVPRTATVRARSPVRTLTITKNDFVVAVTGHPATGEAATEMIRQQSGTADEV